MVERHRQLSDELRYRLLKYLQSNPQPSQRQIAACLGISVGKANYCLRALVERGWVKARNFKNSKNKVPYTYYLTPRGIKEKVTLTIVFLRIRLGEVAALRTEIAELQREGRVSALHDVLPEPASENL
jgi:EPS-associated MarR family transcriptional regulator